MNCNRGVCNDKCKRAHQCSICLGQHPSTKCWQGPAKKQKTQAAGAASSSWHRDWPRKADSEERSHEACSKTETARHVTSDLWWANDGSTSCGKRKLHEASRLGTETGSQATARGGCVETPRIQGCKTTSLTLDGPSELLEGACRPSDSSEFNSVQGNSRIADPGSRRSELSTAKRVVLLLNVSQQPQTTAVFDASGIKVIYIQGFAAPQEPTSTLMSVKQSIREGRVLWLHGRVKPQHWTKPTGWTRCCTAAADAYHKRRNL